MLFYFTSRLVSSIGAFLYPGYASYKTLSQRPASEEELERWLMYWSVLGCIISVEYVAEWLVSWIPFYYTFKTMFLLYLALPQTRGASFLYINHLQPFFHTHETQIDAALASLKAKVYAFLQERVRALWEHVSATIGQQQQQAASFAPAGGAPHPGAPPTLTNPVSGPAQLVSTLWNSFGPGILASGTAMLRQSAAAATAPAATANPALSTPPGSRVRAGSSQQSVVERRRQLEAELAALSHAQAQEAALGGTDPAPRPIPPASPAVGPSRASSASDLNLRERTTSGRFEEVEVPSDVEGYDVEERDDVGGGRAGYEAGRPGAQKRGSWFGWSAGAGSGSGGSGKGGYERVKSD